VSESKFTAALATEARKMGFRVWAVNQTRGKPRFKMDRGVSDLIMFGHGWTVFVETKVDDYQQSDEQKDFQKAAVKNGSKYWVVRTVDDFVDRCRVCHFIK